MISIQTLLRRTAAALGAIAALTVTGPATSQTVNLSNGSSCTYSSMTVSPSGAVNVQCTSGSSAGTFALSASGTSISTNTANSGSLMRVTRSGGSSGAVLVDFSLTGAACTLITQSPLTFDDGVATAQSIQFSTGATAGNCTISINANTPGTNGSPVSRTVAVSDPESNVTFAFAAASSSASLGGQAVAIVVNRTGGSANEWTVPYSLSGGLTAAGALLGGTLIPTSPSTAGTLKFPAGSSTATLTFNPPTVLAAPALPTDLVVSLGTPNTTATTTQTGSVVSPSSHSMELTGPVAGCPVPGTTASTLGGQGSPKLLQMASGGVQTYVLPTPVSPRTTGVFKLSGTTVSFPTAPWFYEIHINKCKGLVQETAGDGCYAKSANANLFDKKWVTKLPTSTFTTKAQLDQRGYCYAPPSEGPWYVNVRYNYAGCTSGSMCGWYAQWTNWSY